MKDDQENDVGAPRFKGPNLAREEITKIGEVDGLRLSDRMRETFAEFDRRALPADERRRAIIEHFKAQARKI